MSTYYFHLGTTSQLSEKEVEILLGETTFHKIFDNLLAVELNSDEEAQNIFKMLGGSIKVLKEVKKLVAKTEEKVYSNLVEFLKEVEVKINFALTEYGESKFEPLVAQELKKALRNEGISSRYIESGAQGVSAAILLHQNNIQELNVIHQEKEIILATTLDIQDIDDWTKRDRNKPYSDRKKGMLPPKIARVMVNLAGKDFNIDNSNKLLYDPFCGSGTVLMEAMLRGYKVAGSDLDNKAVLGSKNNLEWMITNYGVSTSNNVFHADVSSVTENQLRGKVDLVVTEPFLGKPSPTEGQLEDIFKGLEKMYLGAFQTWTKILKEDSTVVIIFLL
jgi:tRNA G10  N-methylase Trm11